MTDRSDCLWLWFRRRIPEVIVGPESNGDGPDHRTIAGHADRKSAWPANRLAVLLLGSSELLQNHQGRERLAAVELDADPVVVPGAGLRGLPGEDVLLAAGIPLERPADRPGRGVARGRGRRRGGAEVNRLHPDRHVRRLYDRSARILEHELERDGA